MSNIEEQINQLWQKIQEEMDREFAAIWSHISKLEADFYGKP